MQIYIYIYIYLQLSLCLCLPLLTLPSLLLTYVVSLPCVHADSSDPMSVENFSATNGNTNNTALNSSSSIAGPNSSRMITTKRSNSEKGPRVRTVLTEQQLQTLRTVYANNSRPDALMKEHLVEITGLNPRVIRVWFQNKRCKDKKKLKQDDAMQHQRLTPGGNVCGRGYLVSKLRGGAGCLVITLIKTYSFYLY